MRLLNRLGFSAALCLTITVPLVYGLFTTRITRSALELESDQVARALEQIVMDRPDLWDYELQRMQEFIDEPVLHGGPEERQIRTSDGRLLAETALRATRPAIQTTVPIHDSGRVVAYLVARRSIRGILLQTLGIALASSLLGWGLFIIFRLLPVKALGGALDDLSEERRKIAATLRAIPDGVITVDGNGAVIFLNPAAEWYLGFRSELATGRPLEEIYPVHRIEPPGPGSNSGRAEIRLEGEPPRIIEERFSLLPSEWNGRTGRVIVFRDITAQLRTEAELLRVRQIESLGVLAGGIAHDFNNYLSAILGNITLAKQDLPPIGRTSERLVEAMKATDRARALSLKLLTFAKGGDPARRVVNLAPLVREAAEFVTHGTGVRFSCEAEPELWNAEVDDGLLSQVIHNLVINAVQAMQGQGQVRLHIGNLEVGEDDVPHVRPGRYLQVRVQDSGPGIPATVLPRIFEPYFTTKAAGNGLGLASCFNIMRAHGGNIFAESAPEGGATFVLYVPATDKPLEPKVKTTLTPPVPGRGHVLVMEDDPVLQEIAVEMLERSGFTAQTCADGGSAIRAYTKAHQGGTPFQAVIMDLTIPGGMGGREAAAHILAIDPEARLIVSSGYSVDPVMSRPEDYGFRGVLPKPYGLVDLSRVLDQVMGG